MREQCGDAVGDDQGATGRHLECLTEPCGGLLARPELTNDERAQPGHAAGKPWQDPRCHQRRLAGTRRADHEDLALAGAQPADQLRDLRLAAVEAAGVIGGKRPYPRVWARGRHERRR
jgi:hypothetical protein